MLLVEGEPGIGKSLLMHEAISEAAEGGFSLAAGAADPLGQTIPFFALRTALGQPFAAPDRDLADTPGWWISQMDAHLRQRADANPVLVCLDDLQWAGQFTLAALRTLPAELKRHPVAWLLARTSTPRTSTPRHDTGYLFDLLERDGATRITLAPLDDDVVTALLTKEFGAPPDQALLALARGAAGNPALLTELISGLSEEKAVRVVGDNAMLDAAPLPGRVHRVAQRRLEGLSERARHLLVIAAVLGPSFRLEDAAEMLGETPAALLPTIEEAMATGIMTAEDNVFSFRHELLCRGFRETIPPPARNALHRQYSRILFGRGEAESLAAGHLLQAAHPGDAALLADLDSVAEQTLRTAPGTAADLALRALELTPDANPGALARAVAATEALTAAGRLDQAARLGYDTLAKPLPPDTEARLRCALSAVRRAQGRPSEAASHAEMVLARSKLPRDLREEALTAYLLALAGPRNGVLASTILADPSQHDSHTIVAALDARAITAWDSGQLSEAVTLLRDAARHGAGVSPDARHPQPLLALAGALVDLRQLTEAGRILDSADQPALHGTPAQAGLSILRARGHLATGHLADAESAAQTALSSAETLGSDGYAAVAHLVLGVIALRRGDIAIAARHTAGLPAPAPHFPGLYARAETALAEAQITEAVDGPGAAIVRIRQSGHQSLVYGAPALAAWLVRTSLAAGDQLLASQITATAVALADANPEFPVLAAAAAHCQGLTAGNAVLVAEAAEQHPDPWSAASAAEDVAVLLTPVAKDQAIRHLKTAMDGYRQTGADRDQARIRRRLRQLGIHRRHWAPPAARPVTGWDSLTGTERAVADLVAQGLNNKQVAARMYISTHTVAHHLRQAFRKLQIVSRVELARIVIEASPTLTRSTISSAPGQRFPGDGADRRYGRRFLVCRRRRFRRAARPGRPVVWPGWRAGQR